MAEQHPNTPAQDSRRRWNPRPWRPDDDAHRRSRDGGGRIDERSTDSRPSRRNDDRLYETAYDIRDGYEIRRTVIRP